MVKRTTSSRWAALFVAYLRLGRFPFLLGGFVFYGLGIAIAAHEGFKIDPSVCLWGQLVVTATQLMVHYGNDYFDLEADRANRTPTAWSGGSRVLPDGLLSPSVALLSAVTFGALALGGTLWLVTNWQLGSLTFPLLLLSIVLAWFYSAPPIRMHSRGMGEVSVTLVLGVLTPLVGYYLQTQQLTLGPILAIIPLCFLQFTMVVYVAIPDVEGDRSVGKRTLVVLLGRTTTAHLLILTIGLAYALVPILVWAGLPIWVACALAMNSPFGAWLGYLLWQGASTHPEKWSHLNLLSIFVLMSAVIFEIGAFGLI